MDIASNPTEATLKLLRGRAAYVARHGHYVDYLHLLLDRSRLPASTWALPNVTNMTAMVEELQSLNPEVPGLNGIVLGRFLHRILSPLLTWHGGYHQCRQSPRGVELMVETTVYRFPEVWCGRAAFAAFVAAPIDWANEHDQWQALSCSDSVEDDHDVT